jgi:hypothetical protein
MKLTNNQWIIVGVVALIAIWYFFIRKKPTSESESSYKVTKSKSISKADCPYCCGWGCEACPWYC